MNDYADGFGAIGQSENLDRAGNFALAIIFGYASFRIYKAYKSYMSPKKRKKKRKTSRRLKHKTTSVAGKRMSSHMLRRIKATTIPMRFFKTHSSRGRMMMKADDWVNEQLKNRELEGKVK